MGCCMLCACTLCNAAVRARVCSVLTAVTAERCGVSTAAVMNGSVVTSQVQLRFFFFFAVFPLRVSFSHHGRCMSSERGDDQGVDTSDISVTFVSRVHLALTAQCIYLFG